MRLVWGTNADDLGQIIAQWAAQRIPHMSVLSEGFGPFTAFGVVAAEGDRLLGGVIFHAYSRRFGSVELSAASDSPAWLTAPVIRGIMSYPFDQLQVERVTAVTPRHAASARRFLKKFGFRHEGTHPKAFGSFGDGISFGLLAEHWRSTPWARGRLSEQEGPRSAPGA